MAYSFRRLGSRGNDSRNPHTAPAANRPDGRNSGARLLRWTVRHGECDMSGPPQIRQQRSGKWPHRLLLALYEYLTVTVDPQPVDLVFVMAGRMERKRYGLNLFRSGLAPTLVLSVGRFEVSKLQHLQLDGYEELVKLRDQTPPDDRHFFITITSSGIRFERTKLPKWNTYGEVVAFRDFVKHRNARRVMVVSTDIHLRRVALTFRSVFHRAEIQFLYCAVPSSLSSVQKIHWWIRSPDRRYVISELIKLAGYRVILFFPAWAVHWVMGGE